MKTNVIVIAFGLGGVAILVAFTVGTIQWLVRQNSDLTDVVFLISTFLILLFLASLILRQAALTSKAKQIQYNEHGHLPVIQYKPWYKFGLCRPQFIDLNLVGAVYSPGDPIAFEDRNIAALQVVTRLGGTQPNDFLKRVIPQEPPVSDFLLPPSVEEMDNPPPLVLEAKQSLNKQNRLLQ